LTLVRPTEISLEVCCRDDVCANLAGPLQRQLAHGNYGLCAVMEIPDSIENWKAEHRTARKRAQRASNRGYYVTEFKREHHEDEIHAINTSKSERQGRPMSEGYTERQSFPPLPDYPCERHHIRTWGVFTADSLLVGYLIFYRCGDLVLVSQLLGHGDYEKDDIMFLLFAVALDAEVGNPGFVVYNRWDSGTKGLRDFKAWLGFAERPVEWLT
jgi:hypothetical protein